MHHRRFRPYALACSLLLWLCELISRPFAEVGIADDWSYIRTAHHLALTGHIVYNGWATALVGWQFYLGAAAIKLFGFSYTAPRMSTLFVALVTAFLLQRLFVRLGLTERNAAFGTLAVVLSPLYMMLSVTFMTDVPGLFAVVACLYGCVRALQAQSSKATIAWLGIAVLVNALGGTSRQIAWLGVLVILPSTLFLLRERRRVLLTGAVFVLLGAVFIAAAMHWFTHQPYSITELPHAGGIAAPVIRFALMQYENAAYNLPFLVLPTFILFLTKIRLEKRLLWVFAILGGFFASVHLFHTTFALILPTQFDWVTPSGSYPIPAIQGVPPAFLQLGLRKLITHVVQVSIAVFLYFLISRRSTTIPNPPEPQGATWQICVLTVPYALAYLVLLAPRSAVTLFDRYSLGLLPVVVLWLLWLYQDRRKLEVPAAAFLLIALFAAYGITTTHSAFAQRRALLAVVQELRSAGIPDTAVNFGWDYNLDTELRYAPTINDPRVLIPANAYTPAPSLDGGPCPTFWGSKSPHIHPLYSLSYDPNACFGPAPFAPIPYSRWPFAPGSLYVVHSVPQK